MNNAGDRVAAVLPWWGMMPQVMKRLRDAMQAVIGTASPAIAGFMARGAIGMPVRY